MGLLIIGNEDLFVFIWNDNILAVVSFVLVNPTKFYCLLWKESLVAFLILFKVIRRGAWVVLVNMILNCVPTVLFLAGVY